MKEDKVQHWETIYETKTPEQVSWTQKIPQTSLDFIVSFELEKKAKIIDVGGGDSLLVDHLLALGYSNITVLDISGAALKRAQDRLGDKANKVTWIQCDILDFIAIDKYDIWHDRAAFHFLTEQSQVQKYVEIAANAVKDKMIVATFSVDGPIKCSGLNITQYNQDSMSKIFNDSFELESAKTEDHRTPFDNVQNFLFCTFLKK
jgi:SAM-dependent methyltransferase